MNVQIHVEIAFFLFHFFSFISSFIVNYLLCHFSFFLKRSVQSILINRVACNTFQKCELQRPTIDKEPQTIKQNKKNYKFWNTVTCANLQAEYRHVKVNILTEALQKRMCM